MSEQLVNAIKQKYGVSDDVSRQVVGALTEIEKHRQASAGMRGGQTPDIMSIVGGLLGGQGQGGQGGNMLGMVEGLLGGAGGQPQAGQGGGGDLMGMLGSLLGGGGAQPPGGHNMASILGDLLGGATHPSQAPDLTSIVGGLLGGGQQMGGQGQDIMGIVNGLLGGGGGQAPSYNQPAQTLNHPTQQQANQSAQHASKPDMGSIGDALGEEIKRSGLNTGGGQKPGH